MIKICQFGKINYFLQLNSIALFTIHSSPLSSLSYPSLSHLDSSISSATPELLHQATEDNDNHREAENNNDNANGNPRVIVQFGYSNCHLPVEKVSQQEMFYRIASKKIFILRKIVKSS
jgi:hypothetical protein